MSRSKVSSRVQSASLVELAESLGGSPTNHRSLFYLNFWLFSYVTFSGMLEIVRSTRQLAKYLVGSGSFTQNEKLVSKGKKNAN